MDQMVPATLYIMLGVVLLLYNLLLAECQRIDQIESEDAMEIENRKNSDDCEVASLELLSLKEELQATGKKILLLTNNNHRYAAVSNGDFEENDQLAGFGDKRRKSKKTKVYRGVVLDVVLCHSMMSTLIGFSVTNAIKSFTLCAKC